MMRKTVLITGCSTGFGKAAALQFRQADWNVIATMRNIAGWSGPPPSAELSVVRLDVLDTASIRAALKEALDRNGRIDCVVNNAGAGLFSVFEATPLETARMLFETNVFGPMQVLQGILPHFKETGGGRIVNVSSSSAIVPEPLLSIYSSTKWALEGFTEALRYELATQNIAVKLVEPGLVKETNFIRRTIETSHAVPIPSSYGDFADRIEQMYMGASSFELGTEDDVAAAIVAAASDETDQLRFIVGQDTKTCAHMRWETSETEYNAWTLSRYGGTI